MSRPFPSPERLRQLLRYDEASGKLFWRPRTRDMFPTQRAYSSWVSQRSGQEAFTATAYGYRVSKIDGKMCAAHRVFWAMVHGYWPADDLDHVNGQRDDNRLSNLREATRSQNLCNRSIPAANTSGHKGVYFHKPTEKWRAQIKKNKVSHFLGCFANLDDAIAARNSASLRLHGEFARAA